MSRRVWALSSAELGVLLVLLNAFSWGLAVLNVATPGLRGRSGLIKGGDFVYFYALGSIAAQGRFDLLYDMDAQHAEQKRLVPASDRLWYVPANGPQMALLLAPFARLPYLWAAAAWTLLTALLYGVCVWVFWRDCPSLKGHKLIVVLAACGFEPFWALVHHGQTSALPLVCFAGGWLALRTGRPALCGFALGSLIIKPHLGIAVAVVMLVRREWRVVRGAVAAIALQWGVSVAVAGVAPFSEYLKALLQGPRLTFQHEANLFAAHGLRGFWTLLCPQPTVALGLYLLTGAGVLVWAAIIWRESVRLEIRYSALLLATVLVAPHMLVYELVQLAPAFLLTVDASTGLPAELRRGLRVLLGLAFLSPSLGLLTTITHVQLSVPVFVGWLFVLHLAGTSAMSVGGEGDLARRGETE